MNSFVHARAWRLGDAQDDGSLHAMGNGRMLVYGQGPDMVTVWGPLYTSTNLLTMSLAGPDELESVSSREQEAPIWRHRLRVDGTDAGTITDVVDCVLPCMIRRIERESPCD